MYEQSNNGNNRFVIEMFTTNDSLDFKGNSSVGKGEELSRDITGKGVTEGGGAGSHDGRSGMNGTHEISVGVEGVALMSDVGNGGRGDSWEVWHSGRGHKSSGRVGQGRACDDGILAENARPVAQQLLPLVVVVVVILGWQKRHGLLLFLLLLLDFSLASGLDNLRVVSVTVGVTVGGIHDGSGEDPAVAGLEELAGEDGGVAVGEGKDTPISGLKEGCGGGEGRTGSGSGNHGRGRSLADDDLLLGGKSLYGKGAGGNKAWPCGEEAWRTVVDLGLMPVNR